MADARVIKATQHDTELTEAQIAVHWREEKYYYPGPKFIGQANLTDPSVNERWSEENFPECYREYGDLLTWDHYWHTTLDTSDAPFWKWYVGGKLNVCFNCVDRHVQAGNGGKIAYYWDGEPEGDRPDNLWEPVDDPKGDDYGAYGEFDEKSHPRSAQLLVSQHPVVATAAGAATAALGVALASLARRNGRR